MNGSPKKEALSIENVEFVRNDEGRRSKKKKKRASSKGSSEAHVLLGTPPSSSNNFPMMYDEEYGEMNPLLGTSPNRGYGMAMPQHFQPYPPEHQAHILGYDYGGYQGQQPPSSPQAYPPAMMSMPPNAMYPYYDQMGAPMYHPMQQQMHSSPQQHSPYNDASNQRQHRRIRSPHGQPQQRHSSASSPPSQQFMKGYPDKSTPSPDGAVHPLKRSPRVDDGGSEYEVPLKDNNNTSQKPSYGAAEKSTPPRASSRPKPVARRKSDTLPQQQQQQQRPPSPLTRKHRRVSSDGKFGKHRRTSSEKFRASEREAAFDAGKHRRSSSDRLPPRSLGRIRKSLNPYPINRRRSYSGGAPSSSSGNLPRPLHTRALSLSEVSLGASVATSASMVSHVSDISKSAFFGGITETGKVQLHFPFENVRLTMDDALPTGVLYMRHVDEDQYEDYHILNDEHIVPWELDGDLPCMCTCEKCTGCTLRSQQLAPNHYIMTVDDDLYRRIFDEIAASRSMPCDLFFCGHHEDVAYPSILIAGGIVAVFFLLMAVATVMTSA